jgi:hypothetical protein
LIFAFKTSDIVKFLCDLNAINRPHHATPSSQKWRSLDPFSAFFATNLLPNGKNSVTSCPITLQEKLSIAIYYEKS